MNTSLKAELDPSNNFHFAVTKSWKSFGKEEHGKTATAKHNDFQGNAKLIKFFFLFCRSTLQSRHEQECGFLRPQRFLKFSYLHLNS